MKYVLVNVSDGSLQIDLHLPNKSKRLNRVAPDVAVSLKRGSSLDILPLFNNMLEAAYAAVTCSKDVIRNTRLGRLAICTYSDNGELIDVNKLLKHEMSRKSVDINTNNITDIKKEVKEAVAINNQPEINRRRASGEPPTYKRYRKEALSVMSKNDLLKLADKLELAVSKDTTKNELVGIISGV